MTTEEAISAERAAIVRAIQAEAEDYRAKARDIWVRDPGSRRISLEEMRLAEELRSMSVGMLRVAVIISQRETKDDRS
jgi:hypothetical protein